MRSGTVRTARDGAPVISVGNLAMGGRGKTPVVAHVARHLVAAGELPAILSRGYGRRCPEDGVVIVSDGRHRLADLDRSGDEPLMLARTVPGAAVLVCEVRAIAARLAERALGATVHVLDDGFQHGSLERDVDIVIVAPEDLRDRPLPFGRLRSPVRALARAHVILIDGDDGEDVRQAVAQAARPASPLIFALRRSIGTAAPLEPDRLWPAGPVPVIAVAGIAQPARFTRALQAAGWNVLRTLPFGDHHRYRPRDLRHMAAVMEETGALGVLTTTKDAVRLLPLRPFPVPVAAVPLEVSIDPPAAFSDWLFERLRETRA